MLLTYFDEVKPHEPRQPWFWMGGIIVPDTDVPALEASVGALAISCFGSGELVPQTEFHASDIFHRKGNFKSWSDIGARMHVLERLTSIMDDHPTLRKVYVRIDPSKMVDDDPEVKAFIFFVEKVSGLVSSLGEQGLMIEDHEKDMAARSIQKLSRFRSTATPFRFGKSIDGLVDTVHYTHSHHSRLLQLAIVCRRQLGPNGGFEKSAASDSGESREK